MVCLHLVCLTNFYYAFYFTDADKETEKGKQPPSLTNNNDNETHLMVKHIHNKQNKGDKVVKSLIKGPKKVVVCYWHESRVY